MLQEHKHVLLLGVLLEWTLQSTPPLDSLFDKVGLGEHYFF
jgi:hypothetical protein